MKTNKTKSNKQAHEVESLGAYLGEELKLVCLVRHWPSLGIARDQPLYGLKDSTGRTVARSKDKARLLVLAARNYSPVKESN